MLARGKDLAEQKRQVRMMKPTVEEHWQAHHEWGTRAQRDAGVWGGEEDRRWGHTSTAESSPSP